MDKNRAMDDYEMTLLTEAISKLYELMGYKDAIRDSHRLRQEQIRLYKPDFQKDQPNKEDTGVMKEVKIELGDCRGIVRALDKLGRISIPKEYRDLFGIAVGDNMEIYCLTDGSLYIRKYDAQTARSDSEEEEEK